MNMARILQRAPLCIAGSRMGSEAGSPLRAHGFSDCEREGVMMTPFASMHNSLNQGRINKSPVAGILAARGV
jgi:hypothetical protein